MIRVILGILLVLALWGRAESATYYVGKSGKDANSCATAKSSTPANRKRTIGGGIRCLAGGDTLIIGAGVYDESIPPDVIPSGSGPGGEAAEAPWPGATVIKAETPCSGTSCTTIMRPSVTANCAASTAAIWITNNSQAKYIIFHGFEVDANAKCVHVGRFFTQNSGVASPHHIRVHNVYWHDALAAQGGTGLIIVGASPGQSVPDHIEVLDSVIKNFNLAGSFPTQGGNHCLYWNAHGTIRRNVIAQCSPTDHNGEGIALHSGPGGYVVDISGNDVSGFGFWGIEASATSNTKIYNNVVHDGGGTDTQCSNVQVACAGIVVNRGATNTLVANNTLYNVSSGNSGKAILRLWGTTNTTIQNNILYGGSNDTISGGDGGSINHNRCASGCTTADNPQFVNAAAGDFRLSASSPTTITQSGVNLSSSFTIDKDAKAWGSTWGLGAYKYR